MGVWTATEINIFASAEVCVGGFVSGHIDILCEQLMDFMFTCKHAPFLNVVFGCTRTPWLLWFTFSS